MWSQKYSVKVLHAVHLITYIRIDTKTYSIEILTASKI